MSTKAQRVRQRIAEIHAAEPPALVTEGNARDLAKTYHARAMANLKMVQDELAALMKHTDTHPDDYTDCGKIGYFADKLYDLAHYNG